MPKRTGIEWTEVTWNPTTGCDRISPRVRSLLRPNACQAAQSHGRGEVPERRQPPSHPDPASPSRCTSQRWCSHTPGGADAESSSSTP